MITAMTTKQDLSKTPQILSIFLIFASSFAVSAASRLEQQIQKPFQEKFKNVTADIPLTTKQNIQKLNDLFFQFRESSRYEKQADDLAQKWDQQIAINHGTSISSATAILRSGQFLSLDELIRRKYLSKDNKFGQHTDAEVDGVIGEQDVVFFSLGSRFMGKPNMFGEVQFELDKKSVLDLGYFTLPSYTLGLIGPRKLYRRLNDNDLAFETPTDAVKKGINRYRHLLFSGHEQYDQLLRLSAVQYLWENDHPQPSVQPLMHVQKHLNRLKDPFNNFIVPDLKKYYEFYNQPNLSAKEFPPLFFQFGLWSLGVPAKENSPDDREFLQRVKSSDCILNYSRFPWSVEDLPGLLLHRHYFWYVKVPTELDVKFIKRIRIPKTQVDQQYQLSQLKVGIEQYSKVYNRKYRVRDLNNGYLVYEFIDSSQEREDLRDLECK